MAASQPIKDAASRPSTPPCWVVRQCIEEVRRECRAYQDSALPCWEQATLCKELLGIDTCFACEVFLKGRTAAASIASRIRP